MARRARCAGIGAVRHIDEAAPFQLATTGVDTSSDGPGTDWALQVPDGAIPTGEMTGQTFRVSRHRRLPEGRQDG